MFQEGKDGSKERGREGSREREGGGIRLGNVVHDLLLACLGGPGDSCVAYLVLQNGNMEYGERQCGFKTKHKSTKDDLLLETRFLGVCRQLLDKRLHLKVFTV